MFENYNGGIENTKGEKFKELKKVQQYLYAKKEMEDYYDVIKEYKTYKWFIEEVMPYLIKLRNDNLYIDTVEKLAGEKNDKLFSDEELLNVIESRKSYNNKFEIVLNSSRNNVDSIDRKVEIKNNDLVKDYILNFLTSNHIFCDLNHSKYIKFPDNIDNLLYNCYLEELRLNDIEEKLDFIEKEYNIKLDLSDVLPHYDISDTFTLKKTTN